MDSCDERAERISAAARDRQLTIATAESLTGGRISCVLGAAPSSSQWYRGIVAYASSVKHGLLRVPDGPVVSEPSAHAMVTSVAQLLGAELRVAVTGVGGPQPQDGQPAGTVWFGVFADGAARTELHHFDGDPGDVVEATTAHALFLLEDALLPGAEGDDDAVTFDAGVNLCVGRRGDAVVGMCGGVVGTVTAGRGHGEAAPRWCSRGRGWSQPGGASRRPRV